MLVLFHKHYGLEKMPNTQRRLPTSHGCGAELLKLPANARMSAGKGVRLCCKGEEQGTGDHQVSHITACSHAKEDEGEHDYQHQEVHCPKNDVVCHLCIFCIYCRRL